MPNDLQNHVKYIVESIENGLDSIERKDEGQVSMDGIEYLSDALDIEFIVRNPSGDPKNSEVLGARVLVAFGGPNIWINTRTNEVEGYWWGDKCVLPYSRDEIGLDEAIQTLWAC